MTCKAAVRDLKEFYKEALKDTKSKVGDVDAHGNSAEARLAMLLSDVPYLNNMDVLRGRLEERASLSENGFNKELKKQFGDIIEIDGNKHYLVGSVLESIEDASMRITVMDAKTKETKDYTVRIASEMLTDSVRVPGLADASLKAFKGHLDNLSKYEGPVEIKHEGDKKLKETLTKMDMANGILGSRRKKLTAEDLVHYHEVPNYTHGNIDSMREIMLKLHTLGSSKADPAMLEHYNNLLDQMHPRFFNEMKLFFRENGVEAFGEVRLEDKAMYIEIGTKKPNMLQRVTQAEAYMHEVIHTMTAWGLRQKVKRVSPIESQLNEAMKVFAQNTTWEDFLLVDLKEATKEQIEEAKEYRDYMLVGEHAKDEFLAHILTSPIAMKLAKEITLKEAKEGSKSLLSKATELFKDLMNAVMGRIPWDKRDMTVFDQVNDLAFQLAEINTAHMNDLATMNPLGQMIDALNSADGKLGLTLQGLIDRLANKDRYVKVPPENATVFAKAKFLLDVVVAGMTNPIHRGFLGVWADSFNLRAESSLREYMSSWFNQDDVYRTAERINLEAVKVETARNAVINATADNLHKQFKQPLIREDEEAITDVVLDTNLTVLQNNYRGSKKYSNKELIQLLTDESYLNERIGRVRHQIVNKLGKDTSRINYTIHSAISLGYYMATGNAHIDQVYSAANIVNGINSGSRYSNDTVLLNQVSELSTLNALKYTKTGPKFVVARLIRDEPKGIRAIMDSANVLAQEARDKAFAGTMVHMIDGYTKELFDDTVSSQVAPVSKAKELEREGYKLRYTLKNKNGDQSSEPMAFYTTSTWGKRGRVKGATFLGTNRSKGTSLKEMKYSYDGDLAPHTFKRDLARVKQEAMKVRQNILDGTFNPENVTYGMGPIINKNGEVTDYRYMMNKEQKKEYLNPDRRAIQKLSKSIAAIQEQVDAAAINDRVLKAILVDMNENWNGDDLGKDGYSSYLIISEKSRHKLGRELYTMLPDNMKDAIHRRADQKLAVRRDLIGMYFGHKHLAFTDTPGINMLPQVIKHVIDQVEGFWKEFIKLSKVAIVIKMPYILAANAISNVFLMMSMGSLNVKDLFLDMKESTIEVDEYIQNSREKAKKEQELLMKRAALVRVADSAHTSKQIAALESEIARLQSAMENSDVHQFFTSGMYQSIVEDVNTARNLDTNRITEGISARLAKAPAALRKAAEWTWLTQSTQYYTAAQEVLQRTDLISRIAHNKMMLRVEEKQVNGQYTLPKWWLEQKGKDYPSKKRLSEKEREEFIEKAKEVRMQVLLDTYINYVKPNGRFEEYLNQIGLLMFTKYAKRSQKVLGGVLRDGPVKGGLLVAAALGGVPTIVSSSPFYKLMHDYPMTYSPLYQIENVFTPPIIKDNFSMGLY